MLRTSFRGNTIILHTRYIYKRHPHIFNSLRYSSAVASDASITSTSTAADTSSSWFSTLASKLSSEIKQQDTTLQTLQDKYTTAYKPWWVEELFATPISVFQDGLEIIHFGLGLPWWSTIALAAMSVRMLCFPLMLVNYRQTHSMLDSQPILKLLMDEYKHKKKEGHFRAVNEEKQWFQSIYSKATQITGYRFYKMFLYPCGLLMSLPPFIFAARGIARRPNHDLDEGGLLWFTNLSDPDIYTILPFVAMATSWCVFSYGAGKWLDGRYTGVFHKYASRMYFALATWPMLLLPLLVDAPTGIFCYWLPFSIFGICSKVFIRSKSAMKKMGIPRSAMAYGLQTEPSNVELRKYYHKLLRDFKRIHSRPKMGSVAKRNTQSVSVDQFAAPKSEIKTGLQSLLHSLKNKRTKTQAQTIENMDIGSNRKKGKKLTK